MSGIIEPESRRKPTFSRQLWKYRWNVVAILTPLVFSPIPIVYTSHAARCAYAIIVMAIYWMTEAIPMAVTALLPIVFMPWFGIMDSRKVCEHYLRDANMLFFGGLMIAVAVEKWNLHKRVALRVLMLVGSQPIWITFGFMGVTAFLSMWLSNTATTAMMVPIAHAVLKELGEYQQRHKLEQVAVQSNETVPLRKEEETSDQTVIEERTDSNRIQPTTGLVLPPIEVTEDDAEQTQDSITFKAVDRNSGCEDNEGCTVPAEHGCEPSGQPSPVGALQQAQYSGVMLRNLAVMGLPDVDMGMPKNDSSVLLLPDNQPPRKRWLSNGGQSNKGQLLAMEDQSDDFEFSRRDAAFKNFSRALKLSIAYAANIGGTATLTGTGPNIVLKGQLDALYGDAPGINFSSWFVLALPNMILALISAWILLLVMFLGPRETFCSHRKAGESASHIIKREYEKLGKMSFAEGAVMCHFIVLALLWLTREPEFVAGWGSLLPNDYVTDSSVAITISALLFLIPSRLPQCFCCGDNSEAEDVDAPAECLLDWKTVNRQMPWGVIILLGGGFALADACKVSGLSALIGDMLSNFQYLPGWAIVVVLCLLTVALTSFTSNVATATIFMPILAELAEMVSINPLYLMIPVTISASFAFILPVSTPPNAIVFSYGDIKILDMLKAGLPMSLICIGILQLAINSWGYAYFNLGVFPRWADRTNATALPGVIFNGTSAFYDFYNATSNPVSSGGT